MLDIKLIRNDSAGVKKAMKNRAVVADVDAIVAADVAHRRALAEMEEARALQNAKSKGPATPEHIIELKELKESIKTLQQTADAHSEALEAGLASLPNIPLTDTPIGDSSGDNVVVSEYGRKPDFGFTPRHYMDFAVTSGIVDTESAAVVSGSRFGYLKGGAAMLEFALLQFALSKLTDERFVADVAKSAGLPLKATQFLPVIPPVLIRPEMMKAMGFTDRAGVQRGSDEIYYIPKDDLYLVGTSEQSVGPMHYDRIIDAEALPLRYVGFSTCFRRESGAAGKDTRGILRVHQFDKLEMFTVCAPDASGDEHKLLLACSEALMQALGLHYRVVRLCTGELGQASAATFDIETWMPGQGEYRETHSISNTTDYQSRALKTRSRSGEADTAPVHMLNGTVFSMNRPIVAILEQFQNEDGTVRVPGVLRPFMGGRETLA